MEHRSYQKPARRSCCHPTHTCIPHLKTEEQILMQPRDTVLALLKHLCHWSSLCRTGCFVFWCCSISYPGTGKFLVFVTAQRYPSKYSGPAYLNLVFLKCFNNMQIAPLFPSWIWWPSPFILWPCMTLLFCFCRFISKHDHEAAYKTHPRQRTQLLI